MRSIVWEGLLLFGKTSLPIYCRSSQELVGLFLTKCGCIPGRRGRLPKIPCSKWAFLVELGKTLLIPNATGAKVFFFEISFLSLSSSIISA